MYHTGLDPWTREPLFIERDPARREVQKAIVVTKPSDDRRPQPETRPTPARARRTKKNL
jgi:hypothetical protein